MYSGLNQRQQNEIKIYCLLGVDYFRKVILWFEKTKNHKKNRRNENYHPSAMDAISLEKHNGFLLYNAFLHSVSMFFVIIYCILALTFGLHNLIIDAIMVVISLLNIYFIILQRTNYLKVREYFCRYYNRLFKKLSCFDDEIMRQIYANEPSLLLSDYEVICKLKDAFDGKKDCYIGNADIDNLKRIQKCVEPLLQRKNSRRTNAVSDGRLLELCSSIKGPYTLLQRRADYLQRMFRVSGRKLLDRTAVITEDADCELLYKKIVPEDTVTNYCLVFILLYELFTNEVKKVKANEV